MGWRFLYYSLTREQTDVFSVNLRNERRFQSVGSNINYPQKQIPSRYIFGLWCMRMCLSIIFIQSFVLRHSKKNTRIVLQRTIQRNWFQMEFNSQCEIPLTVKFHRYYKVNQSITFHSTQKIIKLRFKWRYWFKFSFWLTGYPPQNEIYSVVGYSGMNVSHGVM